MQIVKWLQQVSRAAPSLFKNGVFRWAARSAPAMARELAVMVDQAAQSMRRPLFELGIFVKHNAWAGVGE